MGHIWKFLLPALQLTQGDVDRQLGAREHAQRRGQQPVAVHGAVPVEAAVEYRVQS